MKRKILPLAIMATSAVASTQVAQASDLTVYGKLNGTLQATEESIDYGVMDYTRKDNWELSSNASRIGVKGKKALGDTGLSVVYKVEYEIAHDDGKADDDELKARNMFVGLKGNFGTIIGGKHDTPTKMAQGKIDLFNDLVHGDIKNILVGENRVSNIVMYTTPKASGFYGNVAFIPGEEAGCEDCGNDDSDLADAYSASVNYKSDQFWASLSFDDDINNTDIVRLAGQGKFGNFTLGALLQRAEVNDDMMHTAGIGSLSGIPKAFGMKFEEQDAAILSGSVKCDKFTFKLQYGQSTSEDFYGNDYDATQIAVGVDYKLADKTKLFAYYSQLEGDSSDRLEYGYGYGEGSYGGVYSDFEPGIDVEYQTFGVGIEHKF